MKAQLIRDQLHAIACKLHYEGKIEAAKEIHFLAEAGRRKVSLRRTARHVDPSKTDKAILAKPGMKSWIRLLRHQQKLPYREISALTGVYNHGRLSEVCSGFRT